MDYTKVNKIFCQPLLPSTFHCPVLSKKEEDYIWERSRENLFSGFINRSVFFNKANIDLKNKLLKLSKNYQYKFFGMYQDMFEINNEFKENNIQAVFMKGMALNLADIHNPNQRHCRDIDILIKKKNLNKAYKILKSIGFKYVSGECEDRTSFLKPMHHLPPLSNKRETIVELHHRVTSPQAYKDCPLSDMFLKNCEAIKGVNIPSPTCLMLHATYHGVVQNSLGDGLIFLIDLKKIMQKYDTNLDIGLSERLLRIERNKLLKIEKILSLIKSKDIEYDEIKKSIEALFENDDLFCQERKRKLGRSLGIFKRITIWLSLINYQYQISFFSIKYLRFFFIKIFNLVKRKSL